MSAILGVLFATLVGVMLLPTLMGYQHQGLVNNSIAVTAQQFRLVSDAAQKYIKDNSAAIQAIATPTTPAVITVAMLKTTGYLPQSAQDVNPYNQSWQVQILQPAPGKLQSLVLSSGGDTIDAKTAAVIAAQTGATGGFIPYNGQYGTLTPATAQGAYAGWQVPMAGYVNPGPGHLAGVLDFNNNNLTNSYLYRVAVPGHPELNQMQTNIDMGKNDINNADNVNVNKTVQLGDLANPCQPYHVDCVGEIGTSGYSATTGYPTGWGGGVHTWDIYAHGTVATGANGNQSAWMTNFADGTPGSGGVIGLQSPSGANRVQLFTDNASASVDTTGTMYAGQDITAGGRIGTSGFSATSGYPVGWGGGVHTWDLYSEGSVGVGLGGNVAASMNDQGNIYGAGQAGIAGDVYVGGKIVAQGDVVGSDVAITNTRLADGTNPKMSQAVFFKQMVQGSTAYGVSKPSCPAGRAPQIFTTYQSVSSPDGGAISGQRIDVQDNGTWWLVSPYVNDFKAGGWTPTQFNQVVVSLKCS